MFCTISSLLTARLSGMSCCAYWTITLAYRVTTIQLCCAGRIRDRFAPTSTVGACDLVLNLLRPMTQDLHCHPLRNFLSKSNDALRVVAPTARSSHTLSPFSLHSHWDFTAIGSGTPPLSRLCDWLASVNPKPTPIAYLSAISRLLGPVSLLSRDCP